MTAQVGLNCSKVMSNPIDVQSERDDLSFFTEQKYTDVEFIVENGTEPPRSFKAHKLLLAMRNQVFGTMFYGNLPEGNQVRVKDLDPDAFYAFLKYLYGQQVTFADIWQAIGVRRVADKYLDSKLLERCNSFIRQRMQPQDVCDVLEYAMRHELSDFDDHIKWLLARKGREVLESNAFITASEETVVKILKNLHRLEEPDIIKRVHAWAIACCAKGTGETSTAALQKTLRPFLAELRFLTLSAQEFVEGPCSWNMLTESEAHAVLCNIIKHGSKKLPDGICTSTAKREGL